MSRRIELGFCCETLFPKGMDVLSVTYINRFQDDASSCWTCCSPPS